VSVGSGRRPPPPFLTAELAGREWLTPRLVRVTLEGEPLGELEVTQPASSVRVLIPDRARPAELEIPGWDGNRFVLADGRRPTIRTLTPRYHDPRAGRLVLDVVVHGSGAASTWASEATVGSPVAVSGPARGYTIDPAAESLLLAGDETATAAVSQILEALPVDRAVSIYMEAPGPEARPALPEHPRCTLHWIDQVGGVPGTALVDALGEAELPEGGLLWAAGEAAAMQRLRQRLFNERGIARAMATIRGYWKHGRSGEDQNEAS
jgi:NADPH-dependent ferric siderophore reductase